MSNIHTQKCNHLVTTKETSQQKDLHNIDDATNNFHRFHNSYDSVMMKHGT